jgi:hypothetical protein
MSRAVVVGWTSVMAALIFGLAAGAQATPLVQFTQEVYEVLPGETFDVQVLIDGDSTTPGAQPVAHGLFSFGVELSLESALASVSDVSFIAVVTPLDNFGYTAFASKSRRSGAATAAGNTAFGSSFYAGTLLVSFTVTDEDLVGVGGSYQLGLGLDPNSVPPLFIDGSGAGLDDEIQFGSAQVNVVPEPGTGLLLAGGMALLALICSRCRPRDAARV